MAEENDLGRVWDLVEKIGFCMLATNHGKDIRSRPMTAHADRKGNAVRFLLDLKDHKDLAVFAHVCLAFADTGSMKYVSISGAGELSNDRAKVKEMWSAPYKAFWHGPDDPNIRLLTVDPKDAQYWDSPGKVISYVKMLAAAVSDAKPDMGDHGKVSM